MKAPRVTICIPAYNGGRWIREAVASALSQTYPALEVLVVDDRSTDDSVDQVRGFSDPRLRLEVNRENLGAVRNWNRCIRLARGEWIKFLFQDDQLAPQCVEQMAALFEQHPAVGMVFCRREVLLEDAADPAARAWKEEYGELHSRFQGLKRLSPGRYLFEQYARAGFRANWVGEPSAVMVRRESLRRIGLFHTRMRQGADFEMWIRLMYHFDVGFLEDPLATFRIHAGSLSSANVAAGGAWLDILWLLEGLLQDPGIRRDIPGIRRMRLLQAARVARDQWRRVRGGAPLLSAAQGRALREYLAYRLRGGREPLHEELELG